MDFASLIDFAQAALQNYAPTLWIQAFFFTSAAALFTLQILPTSIRTMILDYGPRTIASTNPKDGKSVGEEKDKDTSIQKLISLMAAYTQVPHSWFWHFYFVSVASSVFWAWQFITSGSVIRTAVGLQSSISINKLNGDDRAIEMGRVLVAWTLMLLQGSRRLYECVFVLKPGKSPMLAVHWALGLLFYIVIGVSIWIEASGSIVDFWITQRQPSVLTGRNLIGAAVFFLAWTQQHICHKHLASLKKYTLPSAGLFRYLICPHYTCECMIYISLAFIAAPYGKTVNASLLSGVVFVVVNLGITACSTAEWYASKFGKEQVASKNAMIPFLL